MRTHWDCKGTGSIENNKQVKHISERSGDHTRGRLDQNWKRGRQVWANNTETRIKQCGTDRALIHSPYKSREISYFEILRDKNEAWIVFKGEKEIASGVRIIGFLEQYLNLWNSISTFLLTQWIWFPAAWSSYPGLYIGWRSELRFVFHHCNHIGGV